MTPNGGTVDLTFPRGCATVDDDRVVIHLERGNLPRLAAYLHALELGLIDVTVVRGAGHG